MERAGYKNGVHFIERRLEIPLADENRTVLAREVRFPFLDEKNLKLDPEKRVPTTYLIPTDSVVNHLGFVAARQFVVNDNNAEDILIALRGGAPAYRRVVDTVDSYRQLEEKSIPKLAPHAIQLELYGSNIVIGDHANIVSEPQSDLSGKSAIVVDDLLDSGKTMRTALQRMLSKGVSEAAVIVPLRKSTAVDLRDPRVKYYHGGDIDTQWVCHMTDPYETIKALEHIWGNVLTVDPISFDPMNEIIFTGNEIPGQDDALKLIELNHYREVRAAKSVARAMQRGERVA